MRIAVTYENENVFQHFGHTEQFKIYDIENNDISQTRILDTLGSGHGALASFLSANGVNVLICGGIGAGAREALTGAGIRLFGGVTGKADDAVEAFLRGNLDFDPAAKCSNHSHMDHKCGENKHGCGGRA